MALSYCQIKYQHREILLKAKPASMLAMSAKATVPVFRLRSGKVLDESMDIMFWALSESDTSNWFYNLNTSLQEEIKQTIQINDDEFKTKLDKYKYAVRFPEHTPEYYRQQSESFLSHLENKLTHNQYLVSDNITLADVAIIPFIRQFSLVEPNWFQNTSYSRLKQWLANFLKSDLFNGVMQKHDLWQDH